MGKRHTAKTGDKSVYKKRSKNTSFERKNIYDHDDDNDDNMYDEVDRYHNQREQEQDDFLHFKAESNEDDGEIRVDGITNVEQVMDLGLDVIDTEEDDDEEEGDEDDYDEELDRSDDDEDNENLENDDDSDLESLNERLREAKSHVMDWGTRKKDYYHGDTADLEIGQDIEDAKLEEETGREIARARFEKMDESDFLLQENSFPSKEHYTNAVEQKSLSVADEKVLVLSSKRKNLEFMSSRDKRKLLNKFHPELLPLVQHFRDAFIKPCQEETLVIQKALFDDENNAQAIGATSAGLQYILSKTMIQASTALNLCQYLLIKADLAVKAREASKEEKLNSTATDILFGANEEEEIKSHPVIERLNQLHSLMDKLEESVERKVPDLKQQIDTLKKACSIMKEGISDEDEEEEIVSEKDSEVGSCDSDQISNEETLIGSSSDSDEDNHHDLDSQDDVKEQQDDVERSVMMEARFGLRPRDDDGLDQTSGRKRRRMNSLPKTFVDTYGDDDEEEEDDSNINTAGNTASKSLALKLNTLTQRMNRKEKKLLAIDPPEYDDSDDVHDKNLKKAFDMMKAEAGSETEGEANDDDFDLENELTEEYDNDDGGFYNRIKKKSKEKSQLKKEMYAVAPKYPRLEEEIEGERPIGRVIMKNRGLKPHRPKINRNPRVKKREQYRKALKRRKGAVRDIRTGEVHKYGGEETGIKSGLSRSRKLGVR